jgi:hypothetical protein
VAETNGLLNRRTSKEVPGVRIPPSPPPLMKQPAISPDVVPGFFIGRNLTVTALFPAHTFNLCSKVFTGKEFFN